MKLKLPTGSQTELFETQKSLIRVISLVSAVVVFIAGTSLQFLYAQSEMSFILRLGFAGLFLLTAHLCTRKSIPVQKVEMLLAFAGSLLLTRVLSQYYMSELNPVHLVSCGLIIVGLSGVFIQKISFCTLLLPVAGYTVFTLLSPHPSAKFPSGLGLILLACSSTVGYFLAWQKIYLIQNSLSHEIHKNTVINNLHEGIILQDTTGRALAINQAACQILNMTTEQILKLKDPDALGSLYREDGVTLCTYDERPSTLAKESGRVIKNFPMIARGPDQQRLHLEVTAIPIFPNTSSQVVESVLITFRDVTELRKAQVVIENHRLQVLANSKLTSLGEMAAGIAHEINNPLTIILGRSTQIQKMIETGKTTPDEILQNLAKITSTTLRISKIVKSMKSLSRDTENDEYQKSNLRAIIDDVINISNDHLQKHEVHVTVDMDPLTELDCNPGLISQVFVNLISNATDAIKEFPTDRWIRIQVTGEQQKIKILFTDSGPGIPAAIKEKILLPFFTTKEAGKGTGIGLSLCRTIVENHGGRFYIEDSLPNTCFAFELPTTQTQKKIPLIRAA